MVVIEKEEISWHDYQGSDLFSLNLQPPLKFADNPRGVLVLQLQSLPIDWSVFGAVQLKPRSLYLMISTDREIHRSRTITADATMSVLDWSGEIIKVSTHEAPDQIFIKLFEDEPSAATNFDAPIATSKIDP